MNCSLLPVYFLAVLDRSITISMLRRQAFLHFPFSALFPSVRSKSQQQIFQAELKVQASFMSEDPWQTMLYILLFWKMVIANKHNCSFRLIACQISQIISVVRWWYNTGLYIPAIFCNKEYCLIIGIQIWHFLGNNNNKKTLLRMVRSYLLYKKSLVLEMNEQKNTWQNQC